MPFFGLGTKKDKKGKDTVRRSEANKGGARNRDRGSSSSQQSLPR
jgi:hypothetical protein